MSIHQNRQALPQETLMERTQDFLKEETFDAAFKKEAKQLTPDEITQKGEKVVAEAQAQNVMVDFALKSSSTLKLNASQAAKLASIKGRNLSNIIMNTPAYEKESPRLAEVKTALRKVEENLSKTLYDFRSNTSEFDAAGTASCMSPIRIAYQEAIFACQEYLGDKKANSPGQADRMIQVREMMDQLYTEVNTVHMLQQRLARYQLAEDEHLTIREMLVKEREYDTIHSQVTEEDKKIYRQNNSAGYNPNGSLPDEEDFENKPLLGFVYHALAQEKMPDVLIRELAKNPREIAHAAEIVRQLNQALSTLPKGQLATLTIMVDGVAAQIFQDENGSLQFTYDIRKDDNSEDARGIVVSPSAETLVNALSMNMIENEDIFGREFTEQFFANMKNPGDDPEDPSLMINNDYASVFLRKELSIGNVDLSNIPAAERIRLAKRLVSREVNKESAKEFVLTYDYGGKEKLIEKNNAKKLHVAAKEKDFAEFEKGLAEVAAGGGYKSISDMIEKLTKDVVYPPVVKEYEKQLAKERQIQDNYFLDNSSEIVNVYNSQIKRLEITRDEKKNTYNKHIEDDTKIYKEKADEVMALYEQIADQIKQAEIDLNKQLGDDLDGLEARYANRKMTKELKKRKEEERLAILKAYEDAAGEIEKQVADWTAESQKDLDALSEQLQNKWKAEAESIANIEAEIKMYGDQMVKDTQDLYAKTTANKDIIDKQWALFEAWKEYYALRKAINAPVVLGFEAWKEFMEKNREKWEAEKEQDEKTREVYEKYLDAYFEEKDELEILKDSHLSSYTNDRVNGQDTLDMIRHRNNVEAVGKLKDKVIFVSDLSEEEKKERTKKEAEENKDKEKQDEKEEEKLTEEEAKKKKEEDIKEGRAWDEQEETLINFMAEFIYAEKTWEMDLEQNQGKRLFKLLKEPKNKELLVTLIGSKFNVIRLVNKVVKKLPTAAMGISEEELSDTIIKLTDVLRDMGKEKVKEVRKEVADRDLQREARMEAKRQELAKQRAGENATDEEIKEEYERLKSRVFEKKPTGLVGAAVGGMMNFFGISPLKSQKKEKTKEEVEFEKALELIDKAGVDDYSEQDKMINIAVFDDLVMKEAFKMIVEETDEDKLNATYAKLSEAERSMNSFVTKQLKGMEQTMKEFADEFFSGEKKNALPIEKVPYYREKGITIEERKKREKNGAEQLSRMISNAVISKDGQGQYLRNVFSTYVSRCSVLDLKSMLASALRNAKPVHTSEKPTEAEKTRSLCSYVGGLFKGAGPLMQKILQGIPDEMIPEGLKEAFDDMKSNLAPIPKEIVEAHLLNIVERSGGSIQKIEVVKSLGAASVGQAFLCDVYTNSGKKQTVIKLLRPDVRNRMLREEKILRRCAREAGPGMLKTFEGQMVRYKEELDLTIEAKNAETGKIYDEGDRFVNAMEISRIVAPTPNALMIDLAPGDTVVATLKKSRELREEKMKDYYVRDENGNIKISDGKPVLRVYKGENVLFKINELNKHLEVLQNQKKLLDHMAEYWVKEAIFGKGFYHGDLHAGNIMMDDTYLTIIDFGNATKLTEFEQGEILTMMLAAAAGDADGFMEGFSKILSDSSRGLLDQKKGELKKIFNEVMHLGNFDSAAERIGAALARAQELGFELPASIYGFQQCQMRVQNTVADFKKEIQLVQEALKQLEESRNLSKVGILKRYDEHRGTGEYTGRDMKMGLLPDSKEDIINLIRSDRAEEFFEQVFGSLHSAIQEKPEKLAGDTYGHYHGYDLVQFNATYNGFISRGEFKEILGDGRHVFLDYLDMGKFKPNGYKEDFEKSIKNLSAEEKDQKRKEFAEQEKEYLDRHTQSFVKLIERVKQYDVMAALENLKKAKAEGKSPEEIAKIESDVADLILKTKEVYIANKKDAYQLANQAQFGEAGEDKVKEANEKAFESFDKEKLWAGFKEALRKEKDPQVFFKGEFNDEMQKFYADPIYGKRIEEKVHQFMNENSKENPSEETINRLLDELTQLMTVPLLCSMGNAEKITVNHQKVDYTEPDEFVQIMGKVVGDEWRKALKKLSIKKIIKYGKDIKGDIERRHIGYWEAIKDAMKEV